MSAIKNARNVLIPEIGLGMKFSFREVIEMKMRSKMLYLGLLTALLGGVVLSGCGEAEQETNEAKNEVKQEANE